jgi:hypothetical protein
MPESRWRGTSSNGRQEHKIVYRYEKHKHKSKEMYEKHNRKRKRKKTDPAIFQKKAAAIRDKKKIAEDVLVSHGYKVRGRRGGGLTASAGGKYVAVLTGPKRATQITATSECPHVVALVFNIFNGTTKHVLQFAELGLDQRGSWGNRQQLWWLRRGRRSWPKLLPKPPPGRTSGEGA